MIKKLRVQSHIKIEKQFSDYNPAFHNALSKSVYRKLHIIL